MGQAGADRRPPAASADHRYRLKSMACDGQFGGRPQRVPADACNGFDEFFGYLYHLDAMEYPSRRNYPPELKDKVGR